MNDDEHGVHPRKNACDERTMYHLTSREHLTCNLKGVISFDKSRPVCRRIRYSAG